MSRTTALVVAIAAAFVWVTSAALPERVASHFDVHGAPDDWMSKTTYVAAMLALVVVLPLLVAMSGRLPRLQSRGWLRLPHRDHWLAPERRDATAQRLGRFCSALALTLAALLCHVHWLVVAANRSSPAQMPQAPLIAGLAVFAIFMTAWALLLRKVFRNVPSGRPS